MKWRLSRMATAGLVLAALAVAPSARAGGLTRTEKALLRDAATAERVIGQRMENARNILAAAAARPYETERDRKKAEVRQRRIQIEMEKAQRSLDAGDYVAAHTFSRRVETLAAREVQQ